MENLNLQQVIEALANSGYGVEEGDDMSHAIFSHKNGKGDAVYLIVFRNDDGQLESGHIYVSEHDGKFFGEY
jgi:hypothetical protein